MWCAVKNQPIRPVWDILASAVRECFEEALCKPLKQITGIEWLGMSINALMLFRSARKIIPG